MKLSGTFIFNIECQLDRDATTRVVSEKHDSNYARCINILYSISIFCILFLYSVFFFYILYSISIFCILFLYSVFYFYIFTLILSNNSPPDTLERNKTIYFFPHCIKPKVSNTSIVTYGTTLHFRHTWHYSAFQTHMALLCISDTHGTTLHFRHTWHYSAFQTHMALLCISDTHGTTLHFRNTWHYSAFQTHMALLCISDTHGTTLHFRHTWHYSAFQTNITL